MSGRIVKHISHCRPVPDGFAGTGSLLCRIQATTDFPNGIAIPSDPSKYGPDHPCFLQHNLEARFSRALMLAYVPIAIGGTAQHADCPDLRAMPFAPAAALQDFGSFIFGDHPLDLEEQLVFRRLPHFVIQEDDLYAIFEQFFQQQHAGRA